MKLSHLNSIASRIAVAMVVAIVLGVVLEIALAAGVNYIRDGNEHSHFILARSFIGVAVDPRRNASMVSSKIATIHRALAHTPASERPGIIASLAEPGTRLVIRDAPRADPDKPEDGRLNLLRQLIQIQFDQPSPAVLVTMAPAHNGEAADPLSSASMPVAMVEIALPDGRWLAVTMPEFVGEPLPWPTWLLLLSGLIVLVGLLSAWTARRLAAPIRDFARAAERLGVDMIAPPLAERGPRELRTAIRAFNLMQERLRRFLQDRTQMLAAISHDLRAPLARLRLRAELVKGAEQQRKMFGDLDAMNAMIDSTLAFARDDARQEPRRLVDLGIVVEDVCEDAADAGGTVCYLGPRGIDVTCRPAVIRRAITNLIDNAVKYGGSARVQVVREAERIVIVIDDDGPGIPADELDRVFAPFYRLEPSRDPGKGGVGLGLSVARTIAREHGGDVTLANRDGGGLRARIELPA
jgi:signal transduction histidine kinase